MKCAMFKFRKVSKIECTLFSMIFQDVSFYNDEENDLFWETVFEMLEDTKGVQKVGMTLEEYLREQLI